MGALLAGAGGSVSLMARTGRHQKSIVLILMFTAWVLSPFVGLAVANAMRGRWAAPVHMAIYGAMLGVSFISLSVYTLNTLFTRSQPAAAYVLVPAACWVLIGVAMGTALALGGRGPAK
jgi:hypothetical protein